MLDRHLSYFTESLLWLKVELQLFGTLIYLASFMLRYSQRLGDFIITNELEHISMYCG